MICYRDTALCVSPKCENKCGRKLTDEIRALAVHWWGSEDAPIAVGYFCDGHGEPITDDHTPPK